MKPHQHIVRGCILDKRDKIISGLSRVNSKLEVAEVPEEFWD